MNLSTETGLPSHTLERTYMKRLWFFSSRWRRGLWNAFCKKPQHVIEQYFWVLHRDDGEPIQIKTNVHTEIHAKYNIFYFQALFLSEKLNINTTILFIFSSFKCIFLFCFWPKHTSTDFHLSILEKRMCDMMLAMWCDVSVRTKTKVNWQKWRLPCHKCQHI